MDLQPGADVSEEHTAFIFSATVRGCHHASCRQIQGISKELTGLDKQGNNTSGSVKRGEFLDWQSHVELLKHSATRSQF
jgi:hypothetical protein